MSVQLRLDRIGSTRRVCSEVRVKYRTVRRDDRASFNDLGFGIGKVGLLVQCHLRKTIAKLDYPIDHYVQVHCTNQLYYLSMIDQYVHMPLIQ